MNGGTKMKFSLSMIALAGLAGLTLATNIQASPNYITRTCESADGQTLIISNAKDYNGYPAAFATFQLLDANGVQIFSAQNDDRSLNGNDYDYGFNTVINTFSVNVQVHPVFPVTIEDLVSSKDSTGVVKVGVSDTRNNKSFACN
jgi:hypothetical protein